jgi:penicillin-binding protein 1A
MLAVIVCAMSAAAFALVVRHFESDLPDVSNLEATYHPPQVTRVLARDGTLLAELFTERRTVIPIDSLPAHVKLAFLAAEDAHFYEHEGLNYLGIIRAMIVNLRAGRTRQGASTITQQVVKNVLLEPERSYRRKIREVLLARRLEQELTKDQILELYLNHIYFGHGRFGIEEASRFYFGRPAREMTISQAAMMAGIVASPEGFSPRNHFDKAQDRRRFVLGQMRDKGFITPVQHDGAMKEAITLAIASEAQGELAPEVVEIAKKALKKAAGDASTLGGYTITTTIDPKMQAAARKAVRDNLVALDQRHKAQGPFAAPKKGKDPSGLKAFEGTPHFGEYRILVGEVTGADDAAGMLFLRVGNVKGALHLAEAARYNPKKLPPSEFAPTGVLLRVSLLAPEPADPNAPDAPRVPLRLEMGPQSALVALDVRTRQVLAVVGNYEAATGALDRATQSRRQPGSTFKPIVYSYALHSRRFTAATLVEARPGSIDGYHPMNFEELDGDAPVRLREALAKSVNVAAVHVAQQVGPANIVEWGHALGLTGKLGADLSLALGAYEVPPIEMANAYSTFASGGMTEAPKFILKIVDSQGKNVQLPDEPPARRVMEANEAYVTTSIMTSVIDHGTGARAKILRRPLAGKTGTSNKAKDAWFVGFSTDISCAVWTGYDDAQPLGKREAGSTAALPAWIDFMKVAHEGRPPTDFPRPPDVTVVRIDPATGLRAWQGEEDAIDEFFLPETEPTETAEPDAGVEDGAATDGSAAADALSIPSMEQEAGTLPTLPAPESAVPLF